MIHPNQNSQMARLQLLPIKTDISSTDRYILEQQFISAVKQNDQETLISIMKTGYQSSRGPDGAVQKNNFEIAKLILESNGYDPSDQLFAFQHAIQKRRGGRTDRVVRHRARASDGTVRSGGDGRAIRDRGHVPGGDALPGGKP